MRVGNFKRTSRDGLNQWHGQGVRECENQKILQSTMDEHISSLEIFQSKFWVLKFVLHACIQMQDIFNSLLRSL